MRTLLVALLTAFTLSPAVAQQPQPAAAPPSVREVAKRKLDVERNLLLAMADSMPETLYRDKATPAQRDFAQQVAHVAQGAVFLCTRFLGATAPSAPDTAATLNSRQGLKTFVNRVYDFAVQTLESQSDADMMTVVQFFGGKEIPKWQVWDEIHTHSMWTAGQIVANFRKHGMAPPAFAFF